jgi:hypothetical protein
MDSNTSDAITKAVQQAFSVEGGDRRYIDITRIPLICQSIVNIEQNLVKIDTKLDSSFVTKNEFLPVKTLVFGFVGLILIAVVTAIVGLVIIK